MMISPFFCLSLQLDMEQWQQMCTHVEQHAPEEACGLVAGEFCDGHFKARAILPVTNELHSQSRYRMNPQEQLAAFELIDSWGMELAAIFHSHPNGPTAPSPTDIAEAYYPQVVYLIWSPRADGWQCLGFIIQNHQVKPITLEILTSPTSDSLQERNE